MRASAFLNYILKNEFVRICVAGKSLEDSVSYINVYLCGSGEIELCLARQLCQELASSPNGVKRSKSTYYDGPRLPSFMLWV